MLDQKGQILIAGIVPKPGHMFADVKPPMSMLKKNTVKELLMRKRQQWNPEPYRVAKCEVVSPDASPQMPSPSSPLNLNLTANFTPPVIENAFMPIQQFQESMQQFQEPMQQFEEPMQQFEEPMQQFEEPMQQFEEPMQQFQEPMQQFQEPMQQFQEPMQQFQEPMQQTQEPMQQTQEPMQQTQEPMQQTQESMQLTTLQGPDTQPEFTLTLFHWQIHRESQKAEGLTVEQLNTQDADGDTYLHIAVAQGKRALAYVLAAKMARCGSLDIKEHNDQTALQIATATNQHLIISDLLGHGAKLNVRDLWGRSPLHVCAEKGYFQSLQSIQRSLAKSGQAVDVEMFNYDGFTPLHVAVLSHNAVVREFRNLKKPCAYMVSELAKKRKAYLESIKTLMRMGASYGTKDLKSGRTCLHIASEEANLELLNIFLEHPTSMAFVNIKSFCGNTALHIVCSLQNYKAQVEVAKLLMNKGADPGMRNYENELPCQLVPEGPVGEKVRQVMKGKCFRF